MWLVLGYIQKVGMKWDKRKVELEKWKNSVGNKIESKLKKELAKTKSTIDVQIYNWITSEYSVHLAIVDA